MHYLALAVLAGWLVYSWKIAAAITMVCGFAALFYAGALEGNAQAKVIKAFSWLVVIMSVLMVGVITQTDELDSDQPHMCNQVEC